MSQWTGQFNVQNQTGTTIYNLQASHTASGCPTQTPVNAGVVSNDGWTAAGSWQTETTSNDDWYWNYNSGSATGPLIQGNKQCNLEKSDTSCSIILFSTYVSIQPNSSSDCTT